MAKLSARKKPRNSAQILASVEKLLKAQNEYLRTIDKKLGDIKLRLGANY